MGFSIDEIILRLEKEVSTYQVPVVDLIATQTKDPFKVLVATILSARTKDEVTAAAARRLFQRVQTPEELNQLTIDELEKLIYPVGFFRNKARYLYELPSVLLEKFSGQVPDAIDPLLKLPGVGRKTANLVVAVAFNKPAICVDTHVHRIMNIWGYVQTKTPLQTEMALREKLPEKYWIRINGLLVAFGQGTCRPQRPHCDQCVLADLCPQLGVIPRQVKEEKQNKTGLRFVSWNVNGLRAAIKNGFVDSVGRLQPDILALQEIKALPEQVPEEVRELAGYQPYWFPAQKKGYSGTAVFCKQAPLHVSYGLDQPSFDDEGRVLTVEFADFFLVNVYSPNAQPELKRIGFKKEFNQALLDYMDSLKSQKTVLVCGDLNVAHKEIDLANPKSNMKNPGFSAEERTWMDEVVAGGYVDTFREFNQDPGQYSWWSYRFNARAKNIGWRIDYFLVDQASRSRIIDAAIHSEITGSDHCPVSILFR
ncbi:exodeoxyribonuclease III [Desulfobulbus rhabdoformis]|uniref:exodeoxyribonuclease III n=1 Tax=Desulfobulbus rhabdoformis TaxID=34032 RepID=UPI00196317DE|nr:exodeoxyribonuclease III [Desulfobulbus rhabdoformis]MBM9613400.1 exodeoxyribonuclease III [Desulfobulbus rhabdoformis]